jgi:threonylcarbamoyladenosine tRNA methylthiotransferase MtaB
MRVHLTALGCRLNEAELETWARQLEENGAMLATAPDDADLIVVNTCAVTAEAARKSRRLLHRARRRSPKAKLVVSGCYATLEPVHARACGIDLLIGNEDKPNLVALALRAFAAEMPGTAPGTDVLSTHAVRRARTRAFLKIQDGCRHRCAYCIVTIARGRERSVPVAVLVTEVNRLAAEGVHEVVLTGVHVGGYGADLGTDLASLVRTLLAETDVARLRLASVEPWDLGADFFALYANRRLQPHLHLPLQSGCDATLKRMARRGRVAEFERLVAHARRAIAGFNVTTDVIVGFPGETDREWAASLEAIERIGFGAVHVFPYSVRAGTAAARYPDPAAPAVVAARATMLRAIARRMQRDFLRTQIGRTAAVLCESKPLPLANGARRWSGYTPNYLRCELDAIGPSLRNTIQTVELLGIAEGEPRLLGAIRADRSADGPAA